jgi:hypothetical protein
VEEVRQRQPMHPKLARQLRPKHPQPAPLPAPASRLADEVRGEAEDRLRGVHADHGALEEQEREGREAARRAGGPAAEDAHGRPRERQVARADEEEQREQARVRAETAASRRVRPCAKPAQRRGAERCAAPGAREGARESLWPL